MNGIKEIFPSFEGAGEIRSLLRRHDWTVSPLGLPKNWSQELVTVVDLMLNAKYPAVVAWGSDALFLYNDAYTYLLGVRHPSALGRPFREVWPEIWVDIEPIVKAALTGTPAYFQDVPVFIHPNGIPEQRWFTSSYSPVRDRNGAVVGMFNAGFETTERVLNERRLSFQVEVSDKLRSLDAPEDIIGTASEMLERSWGRLACSMLKLTMITTAFLSAAIGWTRACSVLPGKPGHSLTLVLNLSKRYAPEN